MSKGYFRGLPLLRFAISSVAGVFCVVAGVVMSITVVADMSWLFSGFGASASGRFTPSMLSEGVRNGFTTVDRNIVSPCGIATMQDSLVMLTSLCGPFQLLAWPVLPSRHTRT